MHAIYGLIDPRNRDLIRYVGYTSQEMPSRIKAHVSEAKTKRINRKHRWVLSLLKIGIRPAYVILEEVTADNWQEREVYWIATLAGPKLTNSTMGGEGLINPSQDVRDRIRDKLTGRKARPSPLRGSTLSGEHRANIANGLKGSQAKKEFDDRRRGVAGRRHTPEAIEKMRQAKIGKKRGPQTPEWREKRRLAAIGKKQSPETIAKRAATQLGNQRSKGLRSEDARQRIAEGRKGLRWVNDGQTMRQTKHPESLPEGWKVGRIKRSHP